ncbi:UDP-glucuronosyltransferase 2B10 [Ooceraea biroi]|uniref:UDP-glucuronosyltransferase 2B10 n=1 Tax=Ooceraea biroi TaxID=2015173 RepID=A0A026WUU1_OOCBI|nr:UDP-glucuronosyltransferase 2B10 [Ooceraea biroi]
MTTSTASLSILLIESFMTTSHHIWAMTLVKGLLQEGHRVHVMSIHEANIEDNLAQNLTYAIFEDVMKEIRETSGHNFIEWMDFSVFYMIYFEYSWGINTCEKIIQTKAAKELLEMIKHHEFDVIVQDITLHQCLYGLWQVNEIYTTNICICVSLYELLFSILDYYYASQRLAEQYVGHKIKPLRELEKTISIVLINSHFTFDNGIPLPPNAIEVGGMHAQVQSVIGVDASHYESMSKFLDEAENGVIVISLGTNVDWKHIGLNKLRAVVLALSKLKQQVLWKLNIDVPVKMPDNVMAVKWLPQNDVLNHKNVKAIWSHGGLLSLQEAIWKGIPVVGMPFILEQRYEMEKLIAKGAGIRLDFNTLSMQSILNALEEIVYNKRRLLLLCILVGLATASTASLSILLVQSITTISHHVWTIPLIKGLLQKGHRVHVVSICETNIKDDLAENLTYAVFDDVMKELRESDTHDPVTWMNYNAFYMTYFTYFWSITTCEKIIQSKAARELLEIVRSNEFDVIVQDVSFHQCLYGLWEVAKGKPVVGFIPLGTVPWLKDYIGGPNYPNVRSYMNAAIARPVNIWQRTLNVLYYIADDFLRHYYYLPASQRLAEQYVGHKIRPLHEIEKSINIILVNSHSTFDNGIPLPPNAIEIGGMHAQLHMCEFFDGAEDGAIIISLGTNVDWKHVGVDKLKVVVLALTKLKQRILWKLDIDASDNVKMPDNVMTVKWLPQNDVLSMFFNLLEN